MKEKEQKRKRLLQGRLVFAIGAKEKKSSCQSDGGKHPVEAQISRIQTVGQGEEKHARNGEYASQYFTTPGNDQPGKAHEEKGKEQHFDGREGKFFWNGADENISDHDTYHQEQHHARENAGKQLVFFHQPLLSLTAALVSPFAKGLARLACPVEQGQMSLLAKGEASQAHLYDAGGARKR